MEVCRKLLYTFNLVVPGRPVISNSGYYTENISSFLDHHLQPLAQAVKSYIKDTNEFLKKLRSLPKLPDDIILCTMDVLGLYPNIPHEEGLSALRKRLETRKEKYVSTDTMIDFAEVVLRNNIFTFGKKNGGLLLVQNLQLRIAFYLWQN